MSDTPETDDQQIIYAMNDNGYQVPCVDLEFARNLKRERDEWAAMCGRYKQERDEAREKYDILATEHMLAVNKLCNERDQAREALREAIQFRDTTLNGYDLDAWLKAAGLTK